MKTDSEIMSACAKEVAEVLVEYNKYRRSAPPYCYGPGLLPFSMKALGLYIDRAVELLRKKSEQKTIWEYAVQWRYRGRDAEWITLPKRESLLLAKENLELYQREFPNQMTRIVRRQVTEWEEVVE